MKIRISGESGSLELDFPMSDAELNFNMRKIGGTGTIPWGRVVLVRDKDSPAKVLEDQTVNLDELNYYVKRLDSLSSYELKVLAIYSRVKQVNKLRDLINLTFSMNGLSLIDNFSDIEQVGKRLYMDEFECMSDMERDTVNFRKFAEDTFKNYETQLVPEGVLVIHGFSRQELYNGKCFPNYIYNSDECLMYLELGNQNGEREYLYLPTDMISLEKVKSRLEVKAFSECIITDIVNLRLPEMLVPEIGMVNSVADLVCLNEMCHAVNKFDETKLRKISLIAEYIQAKTYSDITYIAQHIYEFEVNESVHNDEEYGKYLVNESGLFEVDEVLLPFIDYEKFAASKRKAGWAESKYSISGLVGSLRAIEEYKMYNGEFADLLEIPDEVYDTLYLYSPLVGNFQIQDYDWEEYSQDNLVQYEAEIRKAIEENMLPGEEGRGLMRYFDRSREVAAKIVKVVPDVCERNGVLYGVLKCFVNDPLTVEELETLKEYWCGQMSDGWGEGFEQRPIEIDDGELYVSFWNDSSSWKIMTEEEIIQLKEPTVSMGFSC